MPSSAKRASESLVVYGLGSFGSAIVDEMLEQHISVDLILDRSKGGQVYRGIPVVALEELPAGELAGRNVLIGLHNHYVDVNALHAQLLAAGASRVLTPVNLAELIERPVKRPGYWLEPEFDYDRHEAQFAHLRERLADQHSRDLLDQILRYRRSGDLSECPVPSLSDEYVPADLPRYAGPLKIIDCGAFTGVAIHKLIKAGYKIDTFFAFEPDEANFRLLASRDLPAKRGLSLPLGTWSSTTQLRFSGDGSMGSCLSEEGEVIVQCVAVDDVLHGEEVNLVKLDVEGAEIETLKGMHRIIREQRPNLLVSIYHTAGHLYEVADLISEWELGYRFHLRVHEFNTFGVVLYCLRDALLENRN